MNRMGEVMGHLGVWIAVAATMHAILAGGARGQFVMETEREIPVAYDVDVVVVGGSSGGVAAAVAAADAGAKVFLAAPRPYLGEDLCATWRLWLEPSEDPADGLGKALFERTVFAEKSASTSREDRLPPTPMQVKRVLDEALLQAGVPFLYGCYATEVLRDDKGRLAGIVMANRSGRQAVRAKVIIDATPRAAVARLAGSTFEAYPAGSRTFERVVIGAPPRKDVTARKLATPVRSISEDDSSVLEFDAVEYTLSMPMHDGSFSSFAQAEQRARDITWDPAQVGASEVLFQVPPNPVHCRKHLTETWSGVDEIDLDAFRPKEQEGLYVLGGCADISREAAEVMLRPLTFVALGARIGAAAAAAARELPAPRHARVSGTKAADAIPGDVREILTGIRSFPMETGTVRSNAHPLRVVGSYDVVVAGGGTGGAPAGIAAARQGAKTLVLEYLDGLGGVGTLGLIGKYYYGHLEGFTAEMDKGVAAMGGSEGKPAPSWNVEWKMEWYRRELRKAGAEIWFSALACGVVRNGNRVVGVVVATPEGRGVVLAKVVIDATGNANMATAAGAECLTTDAVDIAVQGTGMPPREPGANYTNTDYTMTDDSDVVDAWRTFVSGRVKYKKAFDLAEIVDSRERRRVVGDYVLSPLDIWNQRTFPDSVVMSYSNFDTHGYTIHPLFSLSPPHEEPIAAYTPYRCLLPKGLDGIIVTGLGISAHRDAMPILRMQADIQNQGYAMGVAAAMAAKAGVGTRDIDIKALQKHLVEKGNLPESVLTDTDSYPALKKKLAAAVKDVRNDYEGVGIVLAFPDAALPLLREAYKAATRDADKRIYAHILGMLGDGTGAATLSEAVAKAEWDKGWSFTGMGQYGMSVSPLDSLIIALGRTRSDKALSPILEKAALLTNESEFSHFRAVSLALETLKDRKAAPVIASLLAKPGITGYACTTIEAAKRAAEQADPNVDRDHSLRELILARALYRCGDHEGIGERILNEYEKDLRGHMARHAHCVLTSK
jgi:flavin-dependent dehydrogenase